MKQKASSRRPAKDLYTSALFLGRKSFVERARIEWWILSAKHGLVHPEKVIAPYDVMLKDAS